MTQDDATWQMIEIRGEALQALTDDLDQKIWAVPAHTLRVARDGDTVKWKINEETWSRPYPIEATR